MFLRAFQLAFAVSINLLVLIFLAMAFFYGLDLILVTSDTGSSDESYTIGNGETTILPGHHFKDGYMTGTLALVIVTWLALALLYRMTFRLKLSPPSMMRRHQSRAWSRKWNATALSLPTIVTFLVYLTFEIVIRICIEFRLHVPVGFAGIEIPSRTVLIIGDIILLFMVLSVNESMIMRLELDQGFRHALYILFIGILCTAVVLLGVAERVYAIVSGVKWGLAWNKPEWSNYALIRMLYCSVYLGLALFSLPVALVVVAKKNRRTREQSSVDLCGMIPMQTLFLIAPALAIHSASAFYFAYFFQYKQKPEPPHLELVRMALVCLPVIVSMVGAWQAKREDVRMNSGSDMTSQDDQREYMLERRSMETDTVPATDAFGQKVADVFEAPVVMSPRHRMWAPHGQNWVSGPFGYENIRPVAGHEGLQDA